MKKLFNAFKEFAMRGNVMDMAVGVVIGAAFGKITTSLVNDVFMPLIGLLIGGIDLGQLNIVLKPEVLDEAGEVVTAAVTIVTETIAATRNASSANRKEAPLWLCIFFLIRSIAARLLLFYTFMPSILILRGVLFFLSSSVSVGRNIVSIVSASGSSRPLVYRVRLPPS